MWTHFHVSLEQYIFPLFPCKHMSLLLKNIPFFISNVLYTWKFIVRQFSYKGIAEESMRYKYTIIHSDAVQVLIL